MDNLEPKPDIWMQNPKLKMLLMVLIFVFLFSGIGLTVFAVWSNNYRKQIYEETEANLPVHRVKQATTTLESQADTAGWKTYRNKEYGFEFEYPQTWEVKGFGASGGNFIYLAAFGCPKIKLVYGESVCPLTFTVFKASTKDDFLLKNYTGKDELLASSADSKGKRGDVTFKTINNVGILEVTVLSDIPGNTKYTVFLGKDYYVSFSDLFLTYNNSTELNHILQTFRFTTKQSVSNETQCAQFRTQAKNDKTGELKDFPTSCVPQGWTVIEIFSGD